MQRFDVELERAGPYYFRALSQCDRALALSGYLSPFEPLFPVWASNNLSKETYASFSSIILLFELHQALLSSSHAICYLLFSCSSPNSCLGHRARAQAHSTSPTPRDESSLLNGADLISVGHYIVLIGNFGPGEKKSCLYFRLQMTTSVWLS